MEQRPSSSHPIASVSPPLSPSPTSPISRLPVELLTQIFTHVPRMEFEESLHWQATQTTPLLPQPTWIAIAQVCQHWRAVATNCKDFWSYIPLQTSPHCVEKSLARSYPRPISFSIDFSPTPRPEWYRNSVLSVLRSLSRARQVHFRGSPNTELWKEASRLLNPVPEVSESGASVQDHVPQDSDSVALPGDISLRCDPTALRSLTLTLCDIYPSSPLFRAPLLSLRLVDCRVEFPLKILALLPQLRTLVLQNTRDTRISSDVLHSALPQLQHLELTNVSSVIAFLLRGIIVPSSSSLSITCTDYTDIEEPLDDVSLLNTVTSNISPALSTHLEGALREGYKYPLLEIASTTSTAKKTLVLLDPAPHAGEHRLQFSLVWADSPESINLFSQMLFMFPSAVRQGIRTLRMREAPILHTANVRSHPLPSTFHDKVRDEAVRGLLAFVMGQGLLPALCQIALESVDLKNPDVDMLVRVLVDRQRSSTVPGEGKISLSLQNCLIDLDSIRSLRDRLGLDAVDIT